MCTHVCTCMQRSEKNFKYQSLGFIDFHLLINLLLLYLISNVLFFIRRPNLPLACNLPSMMGWLASEPQGNACLCYSSPGIRGLFHDTQFFMWILGIKFMFSSLQSKHLTSWVIFSAWNSGLKRLFCPWRQGFWSNVMDHGKVIRK